MTLQEIGRREHRHVGPPHGVLEALVDGQPLLDEFHVDLDHLLLVVAEEPRAHGDGVEDEEFAGLEPGGDLLLVGFERWRRHHAYRLAERVGDVRRGPDRRVLQARGRLDPALVPRKSPERKP